VGGFTSSLLSLAHTLFGPGICPGDWVWATSTAGALIALFPVLGALIVSIVRKGTGNRYDTVTLTAFGTIGLIFVLALPWLLTTGVSETFRAVFSGSPSGLTASELSTFGTDYCIGDQKTYLGGGQNVYETLFYPSGGGLAYGYYLIALLALPAGSLIFMMLQARTAFRRGPKWPSRFLWVPFVLLFLCTAPIEANTAVHLWLGILPFSVLGIIPVALVGPPSWSVINRPARPHPESEPYRPPPQRQSEAQPKPLAPPPPPAKQYAPTSIAPEPANQLAALPGPIPSPPGSRFAGGSRYRRVKQLGHGGFGTVWEAVDTQLNRTVALKIAHAPDRDTEQRMQREARALAAVNHPNCVRVYDLAEEPDGIAAGRLWATMAGALAAAHDRGVLHRDVKPSNVILDPDGLAHLIDFGIARNKGDSKLTATGMMIGTPDFVAPETAMGAPASPASDAWQLAATVSYALSGQPPRGTRETPMAALMAAARSEPVSQLPRRSAHARILIASLDPEPRRRPTLDSVRREVEGWLARAGKSADGPVTRIVPRQQR
jgi:hypothetical protein